MELPTIPAFDLSTHRPLDRSLDTNVFDILTSKQRVGGLSKESAERILMAIPAGTGDALGGGNKLLAYAKALAEYAHAVYASYAGRHSEQYASERAAAAVSHLFL